MNVVRVLVYFEGDSDKRAMDQLLKPLVDAKALEGIFITFLPCPFPGDNKVTLLTRVPRFALSELQKDKGLVVVIVPDLYPMNKGFQHATVAELTQGIYKVLPSDSLLKERFKTFCFKYELETLLLARKEAIETYLQIPSLKVDWTIPVEDQNHQTPPKVIVKRIFQTYSGRRYKETLDAPAILSYSRYEEIAEACPQCFKPFVDFLKGL